jgi:hypothetical protein
MHRYGGKLTAMSELSIHKAGDSYTVEGNDDIDSLPTAPVGVLVALRILNNPTFVNSKNLICQGAVNYSANPGDLVSALSGGDGVWWIYALPASNPAPAN